MANPLYTGTGRGSGLNSEVVAALGQRSQFIKKGDPVSCQFPPNAGKMLVAPQLPSNRNVFVTSNVTSDASAPFPLISLFDVPSLDFDANNSNTLISNNANTPTVTDVWDSVSYKHWSGTYPTPMTYNTASGIPDFFGVGLPSIAFSGAKGAFFPDYQGSAASVSTITSSRVGMNSGLLNWDVFAIVNLPAVNKNINAFMGLGGYILSTPGSDGAALGFSNDRPVIVYKPTSSAINICFATGLTMAANTTYLVNFYSAGGSYGVKVNNLSLGISPSGTSVNDGRLFEIPTASGAPNGLALVQIGGLYGGNISKASAGWDYQGHLGAFRLYAGLTPGARASITSALLSQFHLTSLA